MSGALGVRDSSVAPMGRRCHSAAQLPHSRASASSQKSQSLRFRRAELAGGGPAEAQLCCDLDRAPGLSCGTFGADVRVPRTVVGEKPSDLHHGWCARGAALAGGHNGAWSPSRCLAGFIVTIARQRAPGGSAR